MTKWIRASKLPLTTLCVSSTLDPDISIESPDTEAADGGTAAHEALALIVNGLEPDLVAIAQHHVVDRDDLEAQVQYGREALLEIDQWLPFPKTEVKVRSEITGGTADVLSRDTETTVIVDWKSGRVRREYMPQLAGYAHAERAEHGMPASGRITTIVVWLRYREFEVLHWTSEQLDAWANAHTERLAKAGKVYAPGEHCANCPMQHQCAARDTYLGSAQRALMTTPTEIGPHQLAALYPQIRLLEKAIEQVKTGLKMHLRNGHALPMPDGASLELIDEERDSIDARKAWPVLVAEGLTDDDLAKTVRMTKGAIEEVVSDKAPRGKKSAAAKQVFGRLRDAGAMHKTTIQKFSVRKKGA